MKLQVQDASAKVYDVEAPDDATADEVVDFAKSQIGRDVRLVDKPSKLSYAWDSFKKGVGSLPATLAGGATGLAMTNPMIAQAIQYARGGESPNELRKVPNKVGAEVQRAANTALSAGDVPAPSTASKWLLGRPMEFIGAGMIPGAGIAAAARRPIVAGLTELTSAYGGGLGSEVGELAGKAVAKGGARVVGAGPEMQEAAGEVGGEVGSLAGGFGGGGVTAMAAPRVAAKGVDLMRKSYAPILKDQEEVRRVSESMFTKHFRDSMLSDPRWKARVEQTLSAKAKVPGLEPDLSMATGTPSVAALQQKAETESPSAAARGVAVRGNVEKALSHYQESNFPAFERTLQELSTDELSTLNVALADKQNALAMDVERLRGKVRSGNFGPDEGRELATLKQEEMKAATARTDEKYGEVYSVADNLGFQGSLDSLVSYITRFVRDPNRVAQQKPGFLGDLLSAAKMTSARSKAATMRQMFDEKDLPDSLTTFVSKNGGFLKTDVAGDLPDVGRTPAWARRGKDAGMWLQHNGPTAKSMDHMLEAAQEAGFLRPEHTIDDMITMIRDEIAQGSGLHFRSADWEKAAGLFAQRNAERQSDMGAEGIGHESGARYPASFGPMHSMLKRVREELRYYGTRGSDEARQAMRPLQDMEKILLGEIEEAGPEVKGRLGQADEFFKATVADPFYRGVAARAFADRGLIENVGDRLLKKGEEGAANFKQIFGESERANDLLWNGTLDALAKRIGDGEVTPAKVMGFYEQHRAFLDQFPAIRQRILAVDKAAEGLEARAASLTQENRAVQRDLVSVLTGRNDPEQYLLSIVGNEAAMKQVASWAKKSPQLGQEIARTYVEGLSKGQDPLAVILANEKTLRPVFDALDRPAEAGPRLTHWEKLTRLAEGRTIAARGAPDPVHKPDVVQDPVKALLGTGTSGVFSRIRGAVYRYISPEYLLVDLGGKWYFRVHQEQARELINQALYDPKLIDGILKLEHELTLPKPDYQKIGDAMKEMKPHYASHGLRVAVGSFQREDPGERKSRERGERVMQEGWASGR